MKLERWNPFRELEDMSERLNRLFARNLPSVGSERFVTADWAPSCDITETPEEYIVKMDLPEVKKEDVQVTVEDRIMMIHGERRQEKEEKGKRFHRIERSYGSFARSFTLPPDVDEARVKAEFKDGVLAVHVAKSPAAKAKTVEVKIA